MPYAQKQVGADLADDAMQDAYLRARALLPRYRHLGRSPFFGWACRILQLICRELRRGELKHAHDDETEASGIAATVQDGDPALLAQSAIAHENALRDLEALIADSGLDGLHLAILRAHLADEETATIGRRFAMPENNVRAHLSIAVQRLKQIANPYDHLIDQNV